ncbi:hypothetical protein DL96DRAFT_1623971 [Flagelloscypha sp. PMI_526]|nr:hypothetical protein DL96DRAFT_1623971 [Flagelloscypha sp. PMI_526]
MTNLSAIPLPSNASLIYRQNLAQLISPIRRIRPRVPFFQLAAHRIPTLWYLYRNTIKNCPYDNIRWHVRKTFKREQNRTSAQRAREQLLRGYKWLDAFRKAQSGDDHWIAVLTRYDRLIALKREKAEWKKLAREEVKWQKKMARRPILTGSFIQSSLFHGPLPRMKPQPQHIHNIINARRAKREERLELFRDVSDMQEDIRIEAAFEQGLARVAKKEKLEFNSVFADKQTDWMEPMKTTKASISASHQRDVARFQSAYPPELIETVRRAARERIVNKARERRRERQGEILNITRKRARKGIPAHLLDILPAHRIKMDKVAKSSVSEVGYVGQVKRRLGFRTRGGEDAWRKEGGGADPERLQDLDSTDEAFRVEMRKKRFVKGTSKKPTDTLRQN